MRSRQVYGSIYPFTVVDPVRAAVQSTGEGEAAEMVSGLPTQREKKDST